MTWLASRPKTTRRISARYLENECRLQKGGGEYLSKRRPDGAGRRVSDRNRDRRVQPPGTAFRALALGTQRHGQPRRARHDDRRRPARLFQRAGAAHGRLRAIPCSLPGLARQGDVSADHAQEPLRNPGIRRDGAHDQRGRRPHQRHLRRGRVDAHPLRQSRLQPQHPCRAVPFGACGAGHAPARRHESRRQGIHRGAGRRGSRSSHSLTLCGGGGRMHGGAAGQSI